QPIFESVHNEAAAGSELGGEALFWSADSHFETANYGPAARQYAAFTRQYPDHEMAGAAKYALGWSYFMMGDFQEAIPPFRDFLENHEPPSISLYPYETDVQLRIGDSYFALGEYEVAMDSYNLAIGAEPGGDYAMFQVANSYYRMSRNFEAVTEFRRVLRIYPYSSLREQAQYNIAYIYLNTGNYEQAVEEFRTVIERYPNTEWAARSQYNIGDAYYNAGAYEEAISAYQEVLENYPRSEYVLEAIDGIQYAQLSGGGEDTSTDMLEGFLSENPTSETADRLRYRQAVNRFQSGDYQAAVDEFRQYIRITNREDLLPDAWYNLAEAQLRTDRTEDAIESLRRVALDFPNSERAPAALEQLGQLMVERGEYDLADEYYQRLEESGSRYREQALLGRGRVAYAEEDYERAREQFSSVLEISEQNEGARLGLARVELAEGNYSAARNLAGDVADQSSTEAGAEAQYVLGRSLQGERNYEAAVDAYTQVSVLFEAYIRWVSEAKYRIAEIYILEGRRGDASALLQELQNDYPGTPAAERAGRLLNRR
ncbi:MAG: tetratricopeptide repeat protein, partial [Balneolaceae bacterium]